MEDIALGIAPIMMLQRGKVPFALAPMIVMGYGPRGPGPHYTVTTGPGAWGLSTFLPLYPPPPLPNHRPPHDITVGQGLGAPLHGPHYNGVWCH